jgi:hypothetical protein
MTMGVQIPVITEKPLVTCGCRNFQLDVLGDHFCTCTTHSGAKKDHDWVVDQLADLFRTTHKVKTMQVVKSRGICGDIELVAYLAKAVGPVSLVLDLRKYRVDYNDNPPVSVAFIPTIASTSGRLHSEFVRLLFLQAHWEIVRYSRN